VARPTRPKISSAASAPGTIGTRHDRPDLESTEGRYREAMTMADRLGLRPLVARCHCGLGRLYRRTGRQREAQEHLATATMMYREMDMPFWLEQAEAGLKEGT
jgi:hypothetical protein